MGFNRKDSIKNGFVYLCQLQDSVESHPHLWETIICNRGQDMLTYKDDANFNIYVIGSWITCKLEWRKM